MDPDVVADLVGLVYQGWFPLYLQGRKNGGGGFAFQSGASTCHSQWTVIGKNYVLMSVLTW